MALAAEDVLVVVTTGGPAAGQVEAAYGGPLPGHVLVAPFIPYDLLFRHAAVVVPNGGYTGVTLALAHGVPLVQAGTPEEKTEIGARIRWTGVGTALRTTRPAPEAVRRAVRRMLDEPGFRQAAARVQALSRARRRRSYEVRAAWSVSAARHSAGTSPGRGQKLAHELLMRGKRGETNDDSPRAETPT